MASSGYYYGMYISYDGKAKNYAKQISSVQSILNSLSNTMGDEVNAINNEISALKSDLEKAVRHNAIFTTETDDFEARKECASTSDGYLSAAIEELGEEITRLTRLKDDASTMSSNYYSDYWDAKAAEEEAARQAYLNSLLLKGVEKNE